MKFTQILESILLDNPTFDICIVFTLLSRPIAHCYGNQWLLSTVWLPTFFKIAYFVLNRRTKTHTDLGHLEGESIMTGFFWVNYPFKVSRLLTTAGLLVRETGWHVAFPNAC